MNLCWIYFSLNLWSIVHGLLILLRKVSEHDIVVHDKFILIFIDIFFEIRCKVQQRSRFCWNLYFKVVEWNVIWHIFYLVRTFVIIQVNGQKSSQILLLLSFISSNQVIGLTCIVLRIISLPVNTQSLIIHHVYQLHLFVSILNSTPNFSNLFVPFFMLNKIPTIESH